MSWSGLRTCRDRKPPQFSFLIVNQMPAVSSHDPNAPLPSDLSKLNVAQLKALCKERRIVGYSKLGKAALLAKLGELTPSSPPSSFAQSARCKTQADPLLSKYGSSCPPLDDLPAVPVAEPRAMGPPAPLIPFGPNTVPGTHIPQNSVTVASISALQSTPCPSEERGKSLFLSMSAQSAPVSKRVSSEVSQGPSQAPAERLAKRPRVMVVAPLARQADDAALRFPNSTRLGCSRPSRSCFAWSCVGAPQQGRGGTSARQPNANRSYVR